MKKLFLLFIAVFSLSFINSCRDESEEWGENEQFGFSVSRDTNFNEKAVGETNQFKFNVVTNYDFATIPMKFKYTSSLNGVLKLNDQVLVANTEYPLTNKDNIFNYTGSEEGSHKVEIIVTNDKGVSKTENFDFKYTLSDFTLTYVGGTGSIYQGDETTYVHKITPSNAQNINGYEVRFDSYNGEIKFNGVAAQLGQFYPIANINNFSISLSTPHAGQGTFAYTIKNINSSKPYSIQQDISQREIIIQSANPSSLNVMPNTPMTLAGIISKTPSSTNPNIQYKTWISSATNNQMNGLTTTNNVYTNYALGGAGSFTIPFNAVSTGTYTLNLQVKDEFGNESAVKSFTIVVGFPLSFVGQAAATITFQRATTGISSMPYTFIQLGFAKTFQVQADPAKITSIEYKIKYYFSSSASQFDGQKEFTYTEIINLLNNVNYTNQSHQAVQSVGYTNSISPISNAKLHIKVTANDGSVIEQEIPATVIIN